MLCKTYCATCVGLDAVTVTVEVDISVGIGLHLVGLPDSVVKESLLRVTTALKSYGYRIPGRKIVVNMAPADIRKQGSSYDLAIAIGLLSASEQAYTPRKEKYIIMGELALDGEIRPVAGALPIAVYARDHGFKGCIFPKESASEAIDIEEIDIYSVSNLSEVIDILSDDIDMRHLLLRDKRKSVIVENRYNDFKDVKGQILAKRGLEIAAAGGHNLILVGTPGSGKTFMASCLPSILPPMSKDESIETSKIYSVAGKSIGNSGLLTERPFRTPHHSSSMISLIGGGQNAIPGEISLAHNGVLYLDEIAEFSRMTLDMLRQPLEDGKVAISRLKYKVEYPSSFMLIASMNPCPCGYFGDDSGRCRCSPSMVLRYMSKLSGPLMDRIDMQIYVYPVPGGDLVRESVAESSSMIALRVAAAREIQRERFNAEGIFTNSQMSATMIKKYCRIGEEEKAFLNNIIDKLNISARAYSRILKLSRTIADLEGINFISLRNISEAIQYRNMDRANIYG